MIVTCSYTLPCCASHLPYSRKVWLGEFDEFGKSSLIHQTKTIQIFTYNYNLLVESTHLSNFFSPNAQNE